MSDLKQINNYYELLSYYNDNKHNNLNSWLSFIRVFKNQGKQGTVGLLVSKKNDDNKYVYKMSQYIDYLVKHESVIMNSLNELSSHCPHFCKIIGNLSCNVNVKLCKTESNPFISHNNNTKHSLKKEILLTEYLENSYKFFNYIRANDNKVPEKILYSSIKQILIAISLAQNKKKFTHYDLHSNNIMMRKCNKDIVFLYILDDENQYAVPTNGHYPIIIDFGYSYVSDMEDGPLWCSLAHTDVGFTSHQFDWVADPKLFLVSVSSEIKEKRNTKTSRKLRRIVKNIFYPLDIDWDSGWNKEQKSATDYVSELLYEHNPGSLIFRDYENHCFDMFHSLIILPIEKQDYSGIYKSYKVFLEEWVKIEKQILSPYYNLYILKGIVDAARYVRASYCDTDTRHSAITTFRHNVHDRINKLVNFCKLSTVSFEKMLCSLLILARSMEGVFYEYNLKNIEKNNKYYKQLPLKSVEQIYTAIEINIPDDYIYNNNTTIFILDSIKQTTNFLKLSNEQINEINKIHPISRGSKLYDIFKKK